MVPNLCVDFFLASLFPLQIVCYIYFTRIIAFFLKFAVPFQWKWLYQVRARGRRGRRAGVWGVLGAVPAYLVVPAYLAAARRASCLFWSAVRVLCPGELRVA